MAVVATWQLAQGQGLVRPGTLAWHLSCAAGHYVALGPKCAYARIMSSKQRTVHPPKQGKTIQVFSGLTPVNTGFVAFLKKVVVGSTHTCKKHSVTVKKRCTLVQ